jgi:putative NADPH-quinone reductase
MPAVQHTAMMTNYLLSTSHNTTLKLGTIHDPDTKLKVTVFDLLKSKFKPRKGEVRFFVTAGNETLAFETQGYSKHRKLLILQMVAWYCVYLGLLEAQIHSSLPLLKMG